MRQGQGKYPGKIPSIWLMTDERVADADLLRTIVRLPRGAAIVLRHYGLPEAARHDLFRRVKRAGRSRHVIVLLAGDARLARAWGADGHHGFSLGRESRKPWLHSVPIHNHRELLAAQRAGAEAVLISPLFATRSHPGARPLGAFRFAALARASGMAVIALGGIRPRHAALVRRLGASGYAAIDGLVRR